MIENMITSSALILLICMVRRLFRGRISPRLQYGLWALVLVKLVTGWIVPSDVNLLAESRFSVLNLAELAAEQAVIQAPELEPLLWNISTGVVTAADEPASGIIKAASIDWQLVVLMVWGIGSTGLVIWMAVVHIRFARRLKDGRTPYSHSFSSYPLPVYTVPGLKSPCLYGRKKGVAVYILPETALDQKQFAHVLTHELCHYRHKDHIWSVLRCGFLAFYWMNPLIWVAAFLSKKDCELACDEAAIKLLGEEERIAYGRTLLNLISRQTACSDLMSTATTMTGSEKNIRERIDMIIKKPKMKKITIAAVILIAVVSVAVTFTGAKKTGEEETAVNPDPSMIEENRSPDASQLQTEESAAPAVLTETQAISYKPGDIITITIPELTADTPFGADSPELDYASDNHIIFHSNFGLFVYDLRRRAVIRAVDLKSIGCQNTQGDSYCDVSVSSDGMTVFLHPLDQDLMFVYQVADNSMTVQPFVEPESRFEGTVYREDLAKEGRPQKFQQENFLFCPQMVEYHSGTGWDYEFYLVYTEQKLGSLTLLATDEGGEVDSRFLLFAPIEEGKGTLKKHEDEFYKEIQKEASADASHLYNMYVKMIGSWDYAGVCALSNGSVIYSDRVQESWNTVKGSATLSIEDDRPERGRLCCKLELMIEDPGTTDLKKGENIRYVYMIKDMDGWYADGPMTEKKLGESWWRGAIR